MSKYKISFSTRFKKDKKSLNSDDVALLDAVVEKLANGEKLEAKYKDHALKGNLLGCRDCHIKPDLVLVYRLKRDVLELALLRVGSHSELDL